MPSPPAARRRSPPRSVPRRVLSSRTVRAGVLAAAVGAGSLVLVHPDPYSLTALTRHMKAAGLTGYPMHFAAYAGLAGLAAVLRPRGGRRRTDGVWARRRDAAAWPVFLCLHGVGTEVLQSFVPTRSCDPLDAACDMAGVAAGWAAGSLLAPAVNAAPATEARHATGPA